MRVGSCSPTVAQASMIAAAAVRPTAMAAKDAARPIQRVRSSKALSPTQAQVSASKSADLPQSSQRSSQDDVARPEDRSLA